MLNTQMKNKKETILFTLVMVYLTCYFMQLFGFPDLLMLVLGAVFCLILLFKQKKFRIDLGVCLMAITMFSYCIVVLGIRAIAIMMPYIPIVMYVLSHYLSKEIKKRDRSGMELSRFIYCLVFGHAVHGVLNSYLYFAGYRWEGTRYWMDVWQKAIIPGTQLTLYYLAVFAVLFPAIIYFKKSKIRNVLTVLLSLFFIWVSLATRTRTTLLILALVFFVQGILFMFYEEERVMKNVTPKKIVIFLGAIIVAILILFAVLKDLEVVQAFINNLNKDGGILNNIRFKVQRQAISQIFECPWGGKQMVLDMQLTHNVWLDLANEAGVISFFAFAGYTLWTLYELIRFIMKKEIATEVKLMMVGIYAAFFLYYTVESAIRASIHFMTPWMLINGLVHGYVSDNG